ncbi:hypothetical protein CKY09_16415 [Photorhabdus sp. S5P8-50]|nr:hypothetical protein CKY09_16415 [Photorhabdus sp. S5P8-50]
MDIGWTMIEKVYLFSICYELYVDTILVFSPALWRDFFIWLRLIHFKINQIKFLQATVSSVEIFKCGHF